MRNLIRVVFTTAFFLIFNPIRSNDSIFDKCYTTFSKDSQENCDSQMRFPEGFHNVETDGMLILNPEYFFDCGLNTDLLEGYIYPVVLESDAKDAVLLYPVQSYEQMIYDWKIKNELKAAFNNPDLDTSGMITVITGEDMSRYSNADTAYIYHFELPRPYLGKYNHCTGIYLRKYAHPAMLMKVITTDQGMEKRDEYMHTLLNSITYGNSLPQAGIEEERRIVETRERTKKYGPITWPKHKDGYVN